MNRVLSLQALGADSSFETDLMSSFSIACNSSVSIACTEFMG
jgi:hypothetical protein